MNSFARSFCLELTKWSSSDQFCVICLIIATPITKSKYESFLMISSGIFPSERTSGFLNREKPKTLDNSRGEFSQKEKATYLFTWTKYITVVCHLLTTFSPTSKSWSSFLLLWTWVVLIDLFRIYINYNRSFEFVVSYIFLLICS